MPVQWDDAAPTTRGVQWDEPAAAPPSALDALRKVGVIAGEELGKTPGRMLEGAKGIVSSGAETAMNPPMATVLPLTLGPGSTVVSRLGALGAGAMLDKPSGQPLENLATAGRAIAPAAIMEAAVPLGGKLLRSLPGAKGAISGQDVAAYGQEIGRQSPPLAGASTADELRSLAAGPGRKALGQAKETTITQIESMLPTPTLDIPALGGRMTLRDANKTLSEIGARAFSKNPLDRTIQGVDQRQLYGQLANDIEAALPANARPLWQSAQADYKKGLALLKPLQSSSAFRQYPDELQLNTPKLQEYIANPKNEAALRNKLGDAGFESLVNVLTRGGGVGTRDTLASGRGRMSDAFMQSFGRGTNTGSLQALGVPFRTILPNVGSQYAGRAPYTLPPALQSILDVAAQRAVPQ